MRCTGMISSIRSSSSISCHENWLKETQDFSFITDIDASIFASDGMDIASLQLALLPVSRCWSWQRVPCSLVCSGSRSSASCSILPAPRITACRAWRDGTTQKLIRKCLNFYVSAARLRNWEFLLSRYFRAFSQLGTWTTFPNTREAF